MSYNRDGDVQLVHDHNCPVCLEGDIELPEEDEGTTGWASCSNSDCKLYMEAKSEASLDLLLDLAQRGLTWNLRELTGDRYQLTKVYKVT